VFNRALSFIFKPVLTHLYNNKEYSLSVYQPTAVMKFFQQKYPEVNLLISSLAKSGRLELMTGTYNQNVLTLMQPKDRSAAIEKTTTLIRRLYSQKAGTYFGYGQIWTPSIISALSKSDISRTVISGYDAVAKETIATEPFTMNDLGKKVDVIPFNDEVSKLVSSYAQAEITLDNLIAEIGLVIKKNIREDLVIMINADHLCQGASFRAEDDEKLAQVFFSIYGTASALGYSCALARDTAATVPGCLDEGWYGRDVYTCGLRSFRRMFVLNGNYRYLLNRAVMVLDEVAKYKKDHDVKRELHSLTDCLLSADLFLCNSHLSPLRVTERRVFFHKLLSAERMLLEKADTSYPDSYDLNESGENDLFAFAKNYTAVFNRFGGSVDELDCLPWMINIFDTVPSWNKCLENRRKLSSFTDCLTFADGRMKNYADEKYDVSILSRARTDFVFTLVDAEEGIEISKHYKLRNQTMSLEITILNRTDRTVNFDYSTPVYFTLPGSSAFALDAKRQLVLGNSLNDIRNVRFSDADTKYVLSFTATKSFHFTEEQFSQREMSTIGNELLYLKTRAEFSFPVVLEKDSAFSVSLATRLIDNKEKKNVSTKQEPV
jgi:Glycosyl hydrolase family 57.